MGQRVPIEKLDKEVVDLYVHDLKSKAQQAMYPLKRLCRSKNVIFFFWFYFSILGYLLKFFDFLFGLMIHWFVMQVETLVLDGESTETALLRFLLESGIRNLVLGSTSWGWIRGYDPFESFWPNYY